VAGRRAGQRPVGALTPPALAIGAALLMLAANGCGAPSPSVPARDFLQMAWDTYKRTYIMADGNVIDPARGHGDTTSDGQGYAMLRAAWMRDAATFSRTFQWTEQHLKRPDGLYSWLWTPAGGGKVVDANTAADADQEIAFALVIGSQVFNDRRMLDRARQLLAAIREHERIDVEDGWFPAAGNWAVADRVVNLSYFVPYAYPYFARIDPGGRWDAATDTGYDLILKALQIPSAHLIPDFMTITAKGEAALVPRRTGLSGDFSSDAMRIYWRVAVDCRLHERARACADPLGAGQLTAMLARDGALFTRYSVDGSPLERVQSSSFYGAALPFLLLHAPAAGHAVRASYLSQAALQTVLIDPKQYFDANWVWFGLFAADGLIETATPAVDTISDLY
jgi:endo-1,4-beta-D-glucanase Y